MKSLQRVQTATKIFRILAKIGFICSIVGAACCVIGAIFCGIGYFSETLRDLIVQNAESYDAKEAVSACICAAVSCGFGIAVSYLNLRFFSAVQAEGTPFTKPLVAALRKLGVKIIILSLAESIAIAVFTAIMHTSCDYSGGGAIGMGIFYLLVSLLTDYGADLLNNKEQSSQGSPDCNADENDLNKE